MRIGVRLASSVEASRALTPPAASAATRQARPSGRALVGRLLGLLARAWARTWRTQLTLDPATGLVAAGPKVFAFWHGAQLPMIAARRRRATAVLVSHSRDGELQSGAMTTLGLRVVRGSTSRGGAGGLRRLMRWLDSGGDVALAVDGPRGPARRAKGGAARAAARANAELLPVGVAASSSWVLSGAWDAFEIPWPFARVAIQVGPPIDADRAMRCPALLEEAIERATRRALADLGRTA